MTSSLRPGRGGFLDEFASTYSHARWFLGVGLIGLSIIVINTDTANQSPWALAAAGGVIIAHAFAMRVWDMEDTMVAILVDLTASLVAAAVITSPTDHVPAVLTLVGASVLIGLFTHGWIRIGMLGFAAGFTLVTMLAVHGWRLELALADFLGAVFVSALAIGAIVAIRSRLLELEASRAQTIGVVSHELRNHLAGVIGAAELIRSDGPSLQPGETAELLELAYGQAVEAGEVIEDLLTASRMERGVLDAIVEPVELGPVTETVIRRTSVDGREIIFNADGPVRGLTDPLRYKQILRNLLTNAIRYGGPTIRVSLEQIGDTISLVVADDGDGIDPAEASSLFQPYHRSKNMKRVSGSSGLGLWISRNLAQKMGGDLLYRREGGKTLFELILPAVDVPQEALDQAATETRPVERV